MEERNNDDELTEKPLFGEQFVRRGIERDYIIDLRTSAEKNTGETPPETEAAELESVLVAAVAESDLFDDSVEQQPTIDQSEVELALVKRSALFGAPKPDSAPVPAAIPANLFERPVGVGVADSTQDTPIVLTAGGRSLFEPSAGNGPTEGQSLKDVQFVPAEEARQLPWWIRPAVLSLCALIFGVGAIQAVRSAGSDSSDIETIDVPAVSNSTQRSTVGSVPTVTSAPLVVTTAAPTSATTVVATTEAPATTAAPVTAVPRTTRRQVATTAAPTTLAPITTAPTTEAPTTVAPTTAPEITIVAPTTAPPTSSASTTATTSAPPSSDQLTTAP